MHLSLVMHMHKHSGVPEEQMCISKSFQLNRFKFIVPALILAQQNIKQMSDSY